MKKHSFFTAISIIFITLFILNSCKKDNKPEDTDVRLKYVGTWNCKESTGLQYPVTISLDPNNSSQILLYNFHYQGDNEKAFATASEFSFSIPNQGMCGNTKYVHGTGNYVNDNKLTLLYYVNEQTNLDTINATYTK